jgi:toxin ParE1/3/4
MTINTRSRLARRDVTDIAFYIARDNPEASERFYALVEKTFRALADQPEMGRERPEIGPDIRSLPIEHHPYTIFYRPIPGGAFIVRFLHGARDVTKLL